MQAIIPISLKRIAVKQMQAVESGKLSRLDAEQSIKRICKCSREELTVHLTSQYDQQSAEAFHFFGLL